MPPLEDSRIAPPTWAIRTEADRLAIAAGCYWDQGQADRVDRFASKYIASQYDDSQFQLFEWQRRFVQSLYGWRNADGTRRFRTALLHVPKKNGKTLLVSLVAAYELFAKVQPMPLVASASTTKANANQVFENLIATINRRGNSALKRISRPVPSEKIIHVAVRGGEYRALSADAPNAEGANCSCVLVDEAHAHRSEKLYRTLEFSTIGRRDGLMVIISTAGDDLTHWYYSLVRRGRNLLEGTDTDPSFYAEIYEADPKVDDLESPAVWKRVNPSLDLYGAFTTERFRTALNRAKKATGDWLSFQRYRLNIFCRSEDTCWIELADWDRCKGVFPSEAELKTCKLWLGLDGSQTTDPTSLSAVWLLPGRRFAVRSHAFVAEAGVRYREKTNLPRYTQFEASGAMTITQGGTMDVEAVRMAILKYRDDGHRLESLVIDASGLWVFGNDMDAKEGIRTFRMPQTHRYYTKPMKEFQLAMTEGRIVHDGNEWLRWCLNSVRLDVNRYDEVRPYKAKSADKIDGAVSTLMPFSMAMQAAIEPESSGAGVLFL